MPRPNGLGVVSYGMRFIGDKLSTDVALPSFAGAGTEVVFPGVPYLSLAVRF